MVLSAKRPTGSTQSRVDRLRQQLAGEVEMRLNVRMPKSEYQRLKRFALDQEMTISEVVRAALEDYMGKGVSQ